MQLQINQPIIYLALSAVRESLCDRAASRNKSKRDQPMAAEALGFLALQVLIPILVSLCSCALYDVLKGRILSKLRHKELEHIAMDFCGKTGDTGVSLSNESVECLLDQLSPLGLTEVEIVAMYQRIRVVMESHPRNEAI